MAAMQASAIYNISPGYNNWFDRAFLVQYEVYSPDVYMRLEIYLEYDDTKLTQVRTESLGKKAAGYQSASITLTESELRRVYNCLPNTNEGVLDIRLFTYADEKCTQQVGEASSKKVKLKIHSGEMVNPVVSMTVEPVNPFGAAFDGLYIKGKTKMKITVTASAKLGAKFTSCTIGWFDRDEILYSNSDPKTPLDLTVELPLDNVRTSEPEYPSVMVEDSRDCWAADVKEITVIDYAKPVIDADAYRCDSNGNKSETGTYMRIKAKRSYSKVVSGGVQKNFCEIRYRIKAEGGDYGGWTTILARTAASDEVTTSPMLGNLDTKTSYAVQIQAIDDIGDYGVTVSGLSTEEVYMHRHRNGLALGKYVENGDNEPKLFDVAWNAHFRGEVLIGPEGMTLREYILSVINEGG